MLIDLYIMLTLTLNVLHPSPWQEFFNSGPQTACCRVCCVGEWHRTLCPSGDDQILNIPASGTVMSYNWRTDTGFLLSEWTDGWCRALAWSPWGVYPGLDTPWISANPCPPWSIWGWRKFQRCIATVDCMAHGGPQVLGVPLCGVSELPNRTICRTTTKIKDKDDVIYNWSYV